MYCSMQGRAYLTLHTVPTLPGRSRVLACVYTAAETVPWYLRLIFKHFTIGWW